MHTVHELRSAWKPKKEQLHEKQKSHPTPIRFHRACSWLQCVEDLGPETDLDLSLTFQWIAFNALYGQWDDRLREPAPDGQAWKKFLDRVLALDADDRVGSMLAEHRPLVMAILDDNYLGDYFWRDPSTQRANKTSKDRRNAATWYLEERWSLILENLVDRIYLLRCQLVHGAATHGSNLNRKSLGRCVTMLGHLLPALLMVWIEHGSDEEWGPMCYPPLQ